MLEEGRDRASGVQGSGLIGFRAEGLGFMVLGFALWSRSVRVQSSGSKFLRSSLLVETFSVQGLGALANSGDFNTCEILQASQLQPRNLSFST